VRLTATLLVAMITAAGTVGAKADSADDQRQREQYIQRALQRQDDPALAGHKERSSGTGFYVSDHALLTNYHVVGECPIVTVQSGEQDLQSVAMLAAKDPPHDLALLKTSFAGAAVAEIETHLDRADGSDLYVVGFPSHGLVVRRATLASAVARPAELVDAAALFRIVADVHPGHSGSPLLDEYGAVVGVVARAVDSVTTYQKTGRLVTNIGLAVPASVILEFLREHAVPFRTAELSSASLASWERLERARTFVARIGCWR
jgi:serine protease Do